MDPTWIQHGSKIFQAKPQHLNSAIRSDSIGPFLTSCTPAVAVLRDSTEELLRQRFDLAQLILVFTWATGWCAPVVSWTYTLHEHTSRLSLSLSIATTLVDIYRIMCKHVQTKIP